MSRRAATLLVASVLILILGIAGALIPVPYVALQPGPTFNTLGRLDGKKPQEIIEISGRRSYPTNGHLNFTTVGYQGGPGNRIDLFTALRGWLDPNIAIVPEETVFPKNESTQKVQQENTQEMVGSQESATAAALHELKIPVPTAISIESVGKGMPAAGKLRPGDTITAVDGAKVGGISDVTTAIGKHKAGDTVKLSIQRGSARQDVSLATVASPDKSQAGRPVVGVVLREKFQFPFTIKVNAGDVGGPSAGLMFSLGIYDKLTPGNITGGRFVAGTGTIDPDGTVGPIGGIQQKMIAARDAGASVFLTPSKNCGEAKGADPKGLRLVRVDTMHGALQALAAVRSGHGAVPSCP